MNPTANVSFNDTATAFAYKSDAELQKMYWLFAAMNSNFLVKYGTAATQVAFKLRLPIKFLIKPTIFEHFCGGETIEECQQAIDTLGRYNVGTILDYSVEGEGKEQSFDATASEILATIERAAIADYIPFSVFKVTGLGNPALLEKVQSRQELSADERAAFERVRARVDQICERAEERDVRVFVDAEESWFQDTIDNLAYEMMEKYNRKKAIVYNTYQMYRHDRLDVLKQDYENAVKGNYFLGAKLVRGAYMEKERRVAAEKGYPSPINPTKEASDKLFDDAQRYCINHLDWISFCAGTHNEASTKLLMQLMQEKNIKPDDKRIYFAQLFGMSDNISFNLANANYNVAKYVPYGPIDAVMPYLFRRAQENTAIAGQSSREFNLVKKEIERRKKAGH